jgi:hypothetical protein
MDPLSPVDRAVSRIIDWFEGDAVEDDQDSIRDEVVAALKAGHGDGYAAARYLDLRHGWSADASLVEILDGIKVT